MSDKPKDAGTPYFDQKSLNPKAPDWNGEFSANPKAPSGDGVGASVSPKAPLPDTTGQVAKPLPPSSED
jgi:hypothetical protein